MIQTGKRHLNKASSRFFFARRLLLLPFLPLISACSSLFYQPDHTLHFPPEQLGLSPQEIHFTSSDGTKLFGWFFAAKSTPQSPSKGTIIQFHGNAENLSSHYLSVAWLIQHGYNLFTFDYRGYGRSEGKADQKGTYLDGLAALDEAWKLRSGKAFVVIGQSLGGAIAARSLADFPHRDEVSLLVLDSTFASYKDIARRKMTEFWLTWPLSPLALVLISDAYNAEDAVRSFKIPLLLIHDQNDPTVPYAEGLELDKLAENACWKDFWTLNQGRHLGVFSLDNPEWREKFVSLLDRLPLHELGCGLAPVRE